MKNLSTASLLSRLVTATLGNFVSHDVAVKDNASPTTDRRHKRGILGLPSATHRNDPRLGRGLSGSLIRRTPKPRSRRDKHRDAVFFAGHPTKPDFSAQIAREAKQARGRKARAAAR